MKHNVDVFSSRAYFWMTCVLNSSGDIFKCLEINNWFLHKDFKTEVFFFLIIPVSGIEYLNVFDSEIYSNILHNIGQWPSAV